MKLLFLPSILQSRVYTLPVLIGQYKAHKTIESFVIRRRYKQNFYLCYLGRKNHVILCADYFLACVLSLMSNFILPYICTNTINHIPSIFSMTTNTSHYLIIVIAISDNHKFSSLLFCATSWIVRIHLMCLNYDYFFPA